MGLEGLLDVVQDFGVDRIVKILNPEHLFAQRHTLVGQGCGSGLFVYCIMGLLLKSGYHAVDPVVQISRIL